MSPKIAHCSENYSTYRAPANFTDLSFTTVDQARYILNLVLILIGSIHIYRVKLYVSFDKNVSLKILISLALVLLGQYHNKNIYNNNNNRLVVNDTSRAMPIRVNTQ